MRRTRMPGFVSMFILVAAVGCSVAGGTPGDPAVTPRPTVRIGTETSRASIETPAPSPTSMPSPTVTRLPINIGTIMEITPELTLRMAANVRAVSISADGMLLAAASGDPESHEIGIWSLATGEQVTVIQGHTAIIWDIAFSPDGRYLVTSSQDQTVRVWQVDNGDQVFRFDGPGEIASVAFTPDGRYLAFGGVENWPVAAVWLFQVEGWSRVAKLEEGWNIPAIVFTPDSRLMIAGGISRNVRAWYIPEGDQVYRLYYPGQVYDLALSPDARVLASAPCVLSRANQCVEAALWLRDPGTGAVLKQVEAGSSAVHALIFSPDGKLLAAGNQAGTLMIWTMPETRLLGTLQLNQGTIEDLAFTPDGSRLVSAGSDGTIKVWQSP